MAGLPYKIDLKGFSKAPKGKLPYIEDEGKIVADLTFIRFHIERKYGFDFDAGLAEAQKGYAWAIEKMCEDHLYWLAVEVRFLDPRNFEAGPAEFLKVAPAPIRPLVKMFVLRNIRKTLRLQGLGRHSADDRAALGRRDLRAISQALGDKPFLFGEAPCGADASVGAFVMGALSKAFVSPLREEAEATANLAAYGQRMLARYYPDFRNA